MESKGGENKGPDDTRETDSETVPVPQRTSIRENRRPDYYGVRVYTTMELEEPTTVPKALQSSPEEHGIHASSQ